MSPARAAAAQVQKVLSEERAASGAYTSGERDSALKKLMRFAARSEFDQKHRAALELFWATGFRKSPMKN